MQILKISTAWGESEYLIVLDESRASKDEIKRQAQELAQVLFDKLPSLTIEELYKNLGILFEQEKLKNE